MFAVPLPLRDRQLRLELYRTPNSSRRGRLVSVAQVGAQMRGLRSRLPGVCSEHFWMHNGGWRAGLASSHVYCPPHCLVHLPCREQVWLHDLLPPGLEEDAEACRSASVELESVAKQLPAGRVHLRSTLIDTDLRRAAYQAPFAQDGSSSTAGDAAIKAAPAQVPAAAGGDPTPRLQRLESATEQWSERELRKKTRKTGKLRPAGPGGCGSAAASGPAMANMLHAWLRLLRQPVLVHRRAHWSQSCCPADVAPLPAEEEFEAWQESKRHRAKQAAVGLLPAAADAAQRIAHKGRQQVAAVLGTAGEVSALPETRRHYMIGCAAYRRRRNPALGVPNPKASDLTSMMHPSLPACLKQSAQAEGNPGSLAAPPPPPRPLPHPAGSLLLTVDALRLTGTGSADCFFVLKCGPFWGRSKLLPCTGELGRGKRPAGACGLPCLGATQCRAI